MKARLLYSLLLLPCFAAGGWFTFADEREPAASPGLAHRARGDRAAASPSSAAPLPSQRDAEPSTWGELPLATRMGLERAIADSEPAYAPTVAPGAVGLRSPAGTSATLSARGAELSVGEHHVRLAAGSIGRVGSPALRLASGAPYVEGHEVRSERGRGATEWWRALRSGIEHGVSLAERPAGAGAVRVTIDLGGSLVPTLHGPDVVLGTAAAPSLVRYGDLLVVDAGGRTLAAHFEVARGTIAIVFDDADAAYPVVVDPMIYGQEQRLFALDQADYDTFGSSVAMTADGSRVVVGSPLVDLYMGPDTVGAVYVFRRAGSVWTREDKLIAPARMAGDEFGRAVAISADGTRLVATSPQEDDATGTSTSSNGAAYVFVRSGTTWTFEQKLLAPDKATSDQFGDAIAMSADGLRIVVGTPRDADATGTSTVYSGAAYVYARAGSAWTFEQKLLAPDKVSYDMFGTSVAITGDGSRVVVGAGGETNESGTITTRSGAAYVFTRSGSVWTHEQKLLASGRKNEDALGTSVAISDDGSLLVAGAPSNADGGGGSVEHGAAYVFVRVGSAWSEQQKLSAADGAPDDAFGGSVAMSADGSRILVGARFETESTWPASTQNGAAYVYARSGATWTQYQKVLAPDQESYALLGGAVAMSADGFRLIVGASLASDGVRTCGAARIWELGGEGNACTAATAAEDCRSGFCSDGVCCDSACGGSANDCQACTAALTGVESGTCAALSASVAPTVTCRAAASACDVAETCSSASTTCPADVFALGPIVCRPVADLCDVAESCTGSSGTCPADGFATGTPCRLSTGVCDPGEVCDGTMAACPTNVFVPPGTVCRPPNGACDSAEVCNGAAGACPGDAFASGVVCRGPAGSCDVAESCTGASAQCPTDAFAAPGTPCRPATLVCDVPESCAGAAACPVDGYVADGTPCDDGLVCSQASACQLGACSATLTLDCSDSNACTTDVCSEPSGCAHVPACGLDAGIDASLDSGTNDGGAQPPAAAAGCSCALVGATRGRPAPGPAQAAVWLAFGLVFAGLGWSRARRRRAP